MADVWGDSAAYLTRILNELRTRSWRALYELPDYTPLPSPEGLGKFSFGLWKHERADGSLRIVVQRYRAYFLGYGRISADGFIAYPDGRIEPVPREEMWDYM